MFQFIHINKVFSEKVSNFSCEIQGAYHASDRGCLIPAKPVIIIG